MDKKLNVFNENVHVQSNRFADLASNLGNELKL